MTSQFTTLHKCALDYCTFAITELMVLHKHYVVSHSLKEQLEASVLMRSEFRIVK